MLFKEFTGFKIVFLENLKFSSETICIIDDKNMFRCDLSRFLYDISPMAK